MTAPDVSVWVRARDGALYRDPVLLFATGFVCFPAEALPELVLWCDPSAPFDAEWIEPVTELLRQLFGDYPDLPTGCGANLTSVRQHRQGLRVVPGTDPFEQAQALSWTFEVQARIPKPNLSCGQARYPRAGGVVMDWPPHPRDAKQIRSRIVPG